MAPIWDANPKYERPQGCVAGREAALTDGLLRSVRGVWGTPQRAKHGDFPKGKLVCSGVVERRTPCSRVYKTPKSERCGRSFFVDCLAYNCGSNTYVGHPQKYPIKILSLSLSAPKF